MPTESFLYTIPLVSLFGLTLFFVLVCIGLGMLLATVMRGQGIAGEFGSVPTAATLGLLAFLLAFAFNMTANRFDQRKALLIEEVNAISTAHLRGKLLSAPYSQELGGLLRDYAHLRADVVRGEIDIPTAISRSEEMHRQLWGRVEEMAAGQPPNLHQSLFIQSLNDVIDVHTERVIVGLQMRIPDSIWIGLFVIAGLSMLIVGFQLRRLGRSEAVIATVLGATFSGVIFMISDLDRGGEGFTMLDYRPFFALEAFVDQ